MHINTQSTSTNDDLHCDYITFDFVLQNEKHFRYEHKLQQHAEYLNRFE